MPPTPHPSTPKPLIIVVCESVPTSESGIHNPSSSLATLAIHSRFTWWTMPLPGGTARKLSRLSCPHFRNLYLSELRSYSISRLRSRASGKSPDTSTCTEWSITKSTGTWGLTLLGSPPSSLIASLSAAMSTIAGTPVKSCRITRLGLNGISSGFISGDHEAILFTSSSFTRKPSHFLNADSRRIRIENGISDKLHRPFSSSECKSMKRARDPSLLSNSDCASNGFSSLIISPSNFSS